MDNTQLMLHRYGEASVVTHIEGVGTLIESAYTLCNAIQTNVLTSHRELCVRPDTYVQPTYYY
jgi:hypothetical protein